MDDAMDFTFIEDDALDFIFIEEDAIPEIFLDDVPGDVQLSAYVEEPYYLSLLEGEEYRGIACFSITPDHRGATLSFASVLSGYRGGGIGSRLLKEAVKRLSDVGIDYINCFLYENRIQAAEGFLQANGFEEVYHNGIVLSYDYGTVREAGINGASAHRGEIGYLSDSGFINGKSKSVAKILEKLDIPYMCHEGYSGQGRFLLNEEGALIGVLLGCRDMSGDLKLSLYLDDENSGSEEVFTALLAAQAESFIMSGSENSRFRVFCHNDMLRSVTEALLGSTQDMEWVSEYRFIR